MCSNIGTPKIINFPFGTNGKLMVLGVPIFKHFRVLLLEQILSSEERPISGKILFSTEADRKLRKLFPFLSKWQKKTDAH